MIIASKMKKRQWCFGIMAIFACFIMATHHAHAQSQPNEQQCGQNSIGDMICPPNAAAYTMSDAANFDFSNAISGADIFGAGSPLQSLFSGSGLTVSFGNLEQLFDSIPQILGNVMISKVLELLDEGGNASNLTSLISSFTQLAQGLDGLQDMNCGGSNVSGDFLSYAQNAVALAAGQASGTNFNITNIMASVCGNISGSGGGIGNNPNLPIDAVGEGGERIASCAQQMVGQSTADNPLTEGGALGCALAVSRILDCAGFSVGTHVSTVALYNALDNDPCFQIVGTGHVTDSDAMNLQPGDVLVTQRGERAGHTGVYVGDGKIISNSSGGFNGTAKGTIQQNYTVTQWKKVTGRNVGGSAVFRRVPCDP